MNSDFDFSPLPPPPSLPAAVQSDAEFTAAVDATPPRTCPNCAAPVHGPFCYACGQSEKGMIRHLSEVMSEFADIVFNVDSRIFRSLWDLYIRPGYLTCEYLAGRRARYVTPFRLFFFLSIIAFFSMQMVIPDIEPNNIKLGLSYGIDDAQTADDVASAVNAVVDDLTKKKQIDGIPAEERAQIDEKIAETRKSGAERLDVLKAKVEAARAAMVSAEERPDTEASQARAAVDAESTGTAISPGAGEGGSMLAAESLSETEIHSDNLVLFGRHWDSKTDPVRVSWLSDGLNARLNRTLQHMRGNMEDMNKDPGRMLAGFFAVLPQTLFVLMPLFAVLLKGCYMLKRRLYMEHLLVALHSHAFIFLSVLVILGLGLLGGLAEGRPWVSASLGWLTALAWAWLFLYLFLMQKRVYGQGWIMTFIKYGVVGISYSIILSFALILAGLVSLALT